MAVSCLAVAEYEFVVLPRSAAVVDAAPPPSPRGSHGARHQAAAAAGKIGTDKVLEIASSLALGLG